MATVLKMAKMAIPTIANSSSSGPGGRTVRLARRHKAPWASQGQLGASKSSIENLIGVAKGGNEYIVQRG